LESTFWRTEGIAVNTPAVKIPFGNYASETLEITPCTFNGLVTTPVGSMGSYDIPNYEGGWMKLRPKAHNAYVKREDERLGNKLKPLIRLIKAWKFWDKEMNNYADNKLKTKYYKIVLNNIKFKLILKMFAVVKKGEMYVDNYRNAA